MSSNWWKQLMGSPSKEDAPVHQPLVWSDEATRKFHNWKLEAGFKPYWNYLQAGLEAELQNKDTDTACVSFWKGQGAEGVLFYFDHNHELLADALFLFRYCGDRVKELGYTVHLQDHKKDGKDKELLRLYFKPSLRSKLDQDGQLWSQIYGNLLLELSLTHSGPDTLKIQANSFQDRQYQKVRHFYEFVGQLMQ
jgi:hypothetical protein